MLAHKLSPVEVFEHKIFAPDCSPLKLRKCDASRHGCLRYGQIQTRRKLRRRLNRKMHGRYRRASDV